ncbi:hypothetical protein RRG08_040885 [Elysia crispata]|uniref:Uncharacterized protein n=1 Tax=Elysia crispata TaxID=231223 RepID=A0AAE1B0W0_9GAST|nr:hypothetical protein RRG08_040885 [Elysia crispata]
MLGANGLPRIPPRHLRSGKEEEEEARDGLTSEYQEQRAEHSGTNNKRKEVNGREQVATDRGVRQKGHRV